MGENTWVGCNFITQAKSVAISVWCARNTDPTQAGLYSNRRRLKASDLRSCIVLRIILGMKTQALISCAADKE